MTQTITTAIAFFPEHELACECCGEISLHPALAAALPFLRLEHDGPLTPNSVCRCLAHNAKVGGHPRSLHTMEPSEKELVEVRAGRRGARAGTLGADLRWRGWSPKQQIAFASLARRRGWAVGLHPGFIHVDRRGEIGLPVVVFEYSAWAEKGAFEADVIRAVAVDWRAAA